MHHSRLEVAHEFQLTTAVAGPRWNGHAAEAFRPEVNAKPACEQPVAGHVLEDVFLAHASHMQTAGHEIGP